MSKLNIIHSFQICQTLIRVQNSSFRLNTCKVAFSKSDICYILVQTFNEALTQCSYLRLIANCYNTLWIDFQLLFLKNYYLRKKERKNECTVKPLGV